MTYQLTPRTLAAWRMLDPRRQRAPFSGDGARLYGGRWNPKGLPALYLATDHAAAVAEYYQGIARPGMLAPFTIDAATIADLTDGQGGAADGRVAGALAEDWKTIARIEARMPQGWALAQELIAAGAEGALVPSAQHRGGTNLVLWRWHDAAADGEGAALALLDPERLLGR